MQATRTGEIFAAQIREAHGLLERYFGRFDDSNHTKQAPNLPNHAAWCLGHLALTLHRAAERFGDERPVPESDFIAASVDGDERRFGTETVSFGSAPTDEPQRYPSWERCRQILASAVERAAAAVEKLDDQALAVEVPWGGGKSPRSKVAVRQIFHLGTHCGQIADLRRALNMGSIFK
jgi:hypothetical protein